MRQKRGFSLIPEGIVGWVIAIVVLLFFIVLVAVLSDKSGAALDFLKSALGIG